MEALPRASPVGLQLSTADSAPQRSCPDGPTAGLRSPAVVTLSAWPWPAERRPERDGVGRAGALRAPVAAGPDQPARSGADLGKRRGRGSFTATGGSDHRELPTRYTCTGPAAVAGFPTPAASCSGRARPNPPAPSVAASIEHRYG